LLGKNEAGKSAVMQALWKFQNVAGAKYDPLFDLPAERFVELRQKDPEVVHLEFLLEDGDKAAFTKDFGDVVAAPTTVEVRSTYAGKSTVEVALTHTPARYSGITHHVHSAMEALKQADEGPRADEGAPPHPVTAAHSALETLARAGTPDVPAPEIPAAVIEEALKALRALPAPGIGKLGSDAIAALEHFLTHNKVPKAEVESRVKKWTLDHLPAFIYFEDYGRLRTRIHLSEFISKVQTPPPSPEDRSLLRTQIALFDWTKLDANELLRLGQPRQQNEGQEMVERRKAERSRILESASYQATGDWITWWDPRTTIHQLDITADGDDLELRVSDNVNPWKIPFGERARGFQWFFSFYLTFLVESGKAHQGAILLLDEPGLHLHIIQQLKLLNFFQRVATANQIIYSSHSPFMIDPDRVHNVRTVYLKPKKKGDPKSRAYTRVAEGTEPEGDRETILPMQAAGAYLLAQTVFLGKRTLIVEGVSDYQLLKTLSGWVRDHGGGGLHGDTVIVWSGGTSHLMPLASIMAAREQMGPNRLAVLLDSDQAGLDKANKLLKIFVEGSDNVLLLGTILGTRHAQVEDISEPSELLEALRRRGRIPAVPSTPRPDERNVPFLKRLYVENGWGDLTYDEKAKIVLALADAWTRDLPVAPETEVRARKVFQAANECFEVLFGLPRQHKTRVVVLKTHRIHTPDASSSASTRAPSWRRSSRRRGTPPAPAAGSRRDRARSTPCCRRDGSRRPSRRRTSRRSRSAAASRPWPRAERSSEPAGLRSARR